MPEQIAYEQCQLVQCYKLVKHVIRAFFRNRRKSLELHGQVALQMEKLREERDKRSHFGRNIKRLKELQRVALGKLPVIKSEHDDPNMGKLILMLIL